MRSQDKILTFDIKTGYVGDDFIRGTKHILVASKELDEPNFILRKQRTMIETQDAVTATEKEYRNMIDENVRLVKQEIFLHKVYWNSKLWC